jgi:hypothetical protein
MNHGRRESENVLRLTGLPTSPATPRRPVRRDEESVLIRFGGPGGEQTMSVPLKYVGGDAEAAELRLLARLQEIGYKVVRVPPK